MDNVQITDVNKLLQEKVFNDSFYQFQRVFQPSMQDSPIIDLFGDYQDGNLDHEPEYQRKFVWDDEKQSRYIESIMYGIDTPIIYFIESQREKNGIVKLVKEVIDGRQRLSTIFKFYQDKLKLTGLKQKTPHYEALEGNTFKIIPKKYQNIFKAYSIRTVTFKLIDTSIDMDTQLKFKYQLFYRYNSGLTALNQQEVRNCTYHNDSFLIMFKETASTSSFLKVCPFFKDEVRMADTEFVSLLYFLTSFDDGLIIYSKKWKNAFIDQCYKRLSSEIYSFESYFENNEKIDVDEQDEEAEESIDEETGHNASHIFFENTKNEIIDNLNKTYAIYGDYLTGARLERYIIETLFYNIYHLKSKLTRSFLDQHATQLGKYIYDFIEQSKSKEKQGDQAFGLWDAFNDRVQDTSRIQYRFNKIGELIETYITTTK